jgi:hypothetical protein
LPASPPDTAPQASKGLIEAVEGLLARVTAIEERSSRLETMVGHLLSILAESLENQASGRTVAAAPASHEQQAETAAAAHDDYHGDYHGDSEQGATPTNDNDNDNDGGTDVNDADLDLPATTEDEHRADHTEQPAAAAPQAIKGVIEAVEGLLERVTAIEERSSRLETMVGHLLSLLAESLENQASGRTVAAAPASHEQQPETAAAAHDDYHSDSEQGATPTNDNDNDNDGGADVSDADLDLPATTADEHRADHNNEQPAPLCCAKPHLDRAPPHLDRARRSKVGRNAPCPCGSRMKYKRCCEPTNTELGGSAAGFCAPL